MVCMRSALKSSSPQKIPALPALLHPADSTAVVAGTAAADRAVVAGTAADKIAVAGMAAADRAAVAGTAAAEIAPVHYSGSDCPCQINYCCPSISPSDISLIRNC